MADETAGKLARQGRPRYPAQLSGPPSLLRSYGGQAWKPDLRGHSVGRMGPRRPVRGLFGVAL